MLFVALESELPRDKVPEGVDVYYTGVGKVNAAIKATEILSSFKKFGTHYNNVLVMNYGSAGSNSVPKGTLVECKRFIQNDMNTPFAKQYQTPFDDLVYPELKDSIILEFGDGEICNTQDKFEDTPEGIVDMESYSIAKVCKIYGFDFVAYKYISDDGDVNEWNENHSKGIDKFLSIINQL